MRKLALYFLTIAATQALGLLTFPLIAKNLSVGDFGRYSLAMSLAGLFGALSTSWIRNVAFRTYFDARQKKETRNFLRMYLLTQLAALLLFSAIMLTASAALSQLNYRLDTLVLVIAFVAAGDAYALILNTTRAEEMAVGYSTAENSLAVMRLVALVILARFDLLSTATILTAYSAIFLAGALCLSLFLVGRLTHSRRPESVRVRVVLSLGIPAIPISIAAWVIASSDRLIVGHFLGADALGVYAANYTAADRIVGGLAAASFMFLWPRLLHIHTSAPALLEDSLREATRVYATLTVGPTVAAILFAPTILAILADARYQTHEPIMGLVALGAFTAGFVNQVSRPTEIRKQYRTMSVIATLAAATNLVLTLILVPTMGIMGAALGTLLAYLLSACIYVVLDANRRHRVDWWYYIRLLAASVAVAWIFASIAPGIVGLAAFGASYAVFMITVLRKTKMVAP